MIDLDFLANVPLFRFFTRAELEAAQGLFKDVSFARDDVVVKIDEPAFDRLFLQNPKAIEHVARVLPMLAQITGTPVVHDEVRPTREPHDPAVCDLMSVSLDEVVLRLEPPRRDPVP
jgi:hypothetical protein